MSINAGIVLYYNSSYWKLLQYTQFFYHQLESKFVDCQDRTLSLFLVKKDINLTHQI